MVMLTLFVTVIAALLFTFVATLIPFTRQIALAITNNFVISIITSVIFIIIAALFLIGDSDTGNDNLETKHKYRPAKYDRAVSVF